MFLKFFLISRPKLMLHLHTSKNIYNYFTFPPKVKSQQKGTRLLHHNVKNSMAEASAGISLYLSEHPGEVSESMDMLRAAGQKLRQALRMTWRANQISSIFEGAYTPKFQTVDLSEWVAAAGPKNLVLCGEASARQTIMATPADASRQFVIEEPVVAEMFLAVSFDNVAAHARPNAPVAFTATFADGLLCMDISNGHGAHADLNTVSPFTGPATNSSSQTASNAESAVPSSRSSFSTGLGLNDLREISELRRVVFYSALSTADSRWHSVIKIPASRGVAWGGKPENKEDGFRAPRIRRIAIVDDLPLNSQWHALIDSYMGQHRACGHSDTLYTYIWAVAAKTAAGQWHALIYCYGRHRSEDGQASTRAEHPRSHCGHVPT